MVGMQAPPDQARIRDDCRFVFAVARRIVVDEDAARDVAQEAMLLAHRHRASFRGDSQYRTWLYRIATTSALGHLRRERTRARHLAETIAVPEAATWVAPTTTAIDALCAVETARGVADEIAALTAPHREVLRLRFYDDRSEREAARALGVTTSAVKLRTHRAKAALRQRLTNHRT
jgi:RNA polymerase sigma-70 factor (ECF subfamily)